MGLSIAYQTNNNSSRDIQNEDKIIVGIDKGFEDERLDSKHWHRTLKHLIKDSYHEINKVA